MFPEGNSNTKLLKEYLALGTRSTKGSCLSLAVALWLEVCIVELRTCRWLHKEARHGWFWIQSSKGKNWKHDCFLLICNAEVMLSVIISTLCFPGSYCCRITLEGRREVLSRLRSGKRCFAQSWPSGWAFPCQLTACSCAWWGSLSPCCYCCAAESCDPRIGCKEFTEIQASSMKTEVSGIKRACDPLVQLFFFPQGMNTFVRALIACQGNTL